MEVGARQGEFAQLL